MPVGNDILIFKDVEKWDLQQFVKTVQKFESQENLGLFFKRHSLILALICGNVCTKSDCVANAKIRF